MSTKSIVKIDYRWNLRVVMAERGLFATSDLVPLLASRGVTLSREQVYRLVAKVPARLSLTTLIALCDILECTPSELIEPLPKSSSLPTPTNTRAVVRQVRPKRARVARRDSD